LGWPRKSSIDFIRISKYICTKAEFRFWQGIYTSKSLAPTSDTIISSVCEHYGLSFNELLITRRGIFNEPRNIAVYLLRQIRGENLNNISELFNIKTYSTVSSILRRISMLKKYDRKIKKHIEKIQDSINKGQRQT